MVSPYRWRHDSRSPDRRPAPPYEQASDGLYNDSRPTSFSAQRAAVGQNQINRDVIGEIVVSENNGDRGSEAVAREFPTPHSVHLPRTDLADAGAPVLNIQAG